MSFRTFSIYIGKFFSSKTAKSTSVHVLSHMNALFKNTFLRNKEKSNNFWYIITKMNEELC